MHNQFKAAAAVVLAFGFSQASIVGGKSVSIAEAPWQLKLEASGSGCGAAWVGGRNVITAWHCVEDAVASGTYIWHGQTVESRMNNSNRIAVQQIITYPNADLSSDIAILKLAADIPASSLARPIRFATAADATAGLTEAGKACMATGWGFISIDPDRTKDSLQQVFSVIHRNNDKGIIDWAGQGGSTWIGSCMGDSGGPLAVKDATGTGWILAGISSHISSKCGDPNSPSSYCRVTTYANWLAQNGVTQPAVDIQRYAIAGPGITLNGSYLLLARAAELEIALVNLAGGTLRMSSGHFQEGRHALPVGGLPGGRYAVKVRSVDGVRCGMLNLR